MWLQTHSSYYYAKIHNMISYTVIVISSVSSAALFSSSHYVVGDINLVNYIVGSLNIVSAILIAINRQLKPSELYQSHAQMGKKYHNLIRTIDACLSLTRDLRPNAIVFLEKVGREIDILENNQVDPPRCIAKKFEKMFGSIDGLMYGDDVVELLKIDYKTKKELKRYAKKHRVDVSSNNSLDNTIVNTEYNSSDRNTPEITVEINSPTSKFDYLLKKQSVLKRCDTINK